MRGATVYHAIGDADARDEYDDAHARGVSASAELALEVDHARCVDMDDAAAYDASAAGTHSSVRASGSRAAMVVHSSAESAVDADAPSHASDADDGDAPHGDAARDPHDAADPAVVYRAVADDRDDDRNVGGRVQPDD